VGLQALVKKNLTNPSKSTVNPKASSVPVHALVAMSNDLGLVNVGSSSGMEDPNVAAKKKAIHIKWR